MYTESFENLIYGDDGQSPIRPMLMRVLTDVKKDAVRLRIDIRTTPQGTNNSRNEAQLVIDPDETDADGIMRILVERLNDSPGEGFLGQVRMNFSEAGASGRRYASWTRTIRAPSPASRISTPSEEGEEEVEDDNDNSSTSFGRGGGSKNSRRGGGVLRYLGGRPPAWASLPAWMPTDLKHLLVEVRTALGPDLQSVTITPTGIRWTREVRVVEDGEVSL